MSSASEEDRHLHRGVIITPRQQMISSCSGAFLTSLMMTPLDVVKIRLQSQAKPSAFTKGHCFVYCNGLMDHLCPCVNGLTPSSTWYKRPGQFNGTFDAMIKIARNEGITSLWSGLPPTLVMAVPATVVYFTSYEQLKGWMGYRDDLLSNRWKPMAAGSTARVWAATLISPIEMIRTKMQSEYLTYAQIWKAIGDTVKNNGLLSLWRGLGPTLLRDVPFSGMYWASYEAVKAYVLTTQGRHTLSFFESFSAGAVAGSIAAVLTLPFDVIKTRRQIELGEVLVGSRKKPTSTWKLISIIYSKEGFRALFAGLPPRLIKVAPSCAIMISTYEFFKHFFAARNKHAEEEDFFLNQPQSQNQNFIPDIVQVDVPVISLVSSPSSSLPVSSPASKSS